MPCLHKTLVYSLYQVCCVLVFPLLSYKICIIYCIAVDVVIVYQQIMELVFYILSHYQVSCSSAFPLLSYANMHLLIFPCCGTKRTLFTNKLSQYWQSNKSWSSTFLPGFVYVSVLVSELLKHACHIVMKLFFAISVMFTICQFPARCQTLCLHQVSSVYVVQLARFAKSTRGRYI